MSEYNDPEPWVPVPPPENSYWDDMPPHCPECDVLLQSLHPASRADGEWEGWCPKHGEVVPVYHDSRISENDEEE